MAATVANSPVDREDDRQDLPVLLIALALIIAVIPTEWVLPGALGGHGSPARLIGYTMFGLCVLSFLVQRRAGVKSINPVYLILLTYVFLSMAYWGYGFFRLGSDFVEGLKSAALLTIVAPVGVGLYAAYRMRSSRTRRIVLGCLLIGLSWNGLVGVLQNFTDIDWRTSLIPPGLVDNLEAKGLAKAALAERFGATRSVGTSNLAIEFAVLAGITVPLALHFARFGRSRFVRIASSLATVLALVAVPAGVSRSGLIALLVGAILYVWALNVRQLAIAVSGFAFAIFLQAVFAPNNLTALLKSVTDVEDDGSVRSRLEGMARATADFKANPIFGLGMGTTPPAEYGWLDNQWMQQLAQGGLVGFFAMLSLVVGGVFGIAAALRVARGAADRDRASERDLAYAIGAMVLGLLATSYTFDLFANQQGTLIFFLLLGTLWSGFSVPLTRSARRTTDAGVDHSTPALSPAE